MDENQTEEIQPEQNQVEQPEQDQSSSELTPTQPKPTSPVYQAGKTNWVKLILIYAVIGLIVYGVIWYFFLRGSNAPY